MNVKNFVKRIVNNNRLGIWYMDKNKEIIEVFETVLFALVCPFVFILENKEKKDDEEIKKWIIFIF